MAISKGVPNRSLFKLIHRSGYNPNVKTLQAVSKGTSLLTHERTRLEEAVAVRPILVRRHYRLPDRYDVAGLEMIRQTVKYFNILLAGSSPVALTVAKAFHSTGT